MATDQEMKALKDNLAKIREAVKFEAKKIHSIIVNEENLVDSDSIVSLSRANDEAMGAHIVLSALRKFGHLPLERLIEQLEFNFHSHMNDGVTPTPTLKVMSNSLVYLRSL